MARALKIPSVRRAPRRPPVLVEPEDDVFQEMTLAEHLDELRQRIVRICLAIGIAFIGGVILAVPLLKLIQRTALGSLKDENGEPLRFDNVGVTDGIVDFFKTALFIALVIAFPVIFYQLFAFIAPGLTRKEKRIVYNSLPFVILLFLIGSSFAFFFAIPRAFAFLGNFQSDIFQFSPTFSSVAAFFIQVSVGLGLAFEMPVIMYLLARIGVVNDKQMSTKRRYAAVIVMIAAALITPTPDPVNMLVVALPIYIIFEIGLIFARIGAKRHARAAEKEAAEEAAAAG